jgi:hypothetical protein
MKKKEKYMKLLPFCEMSKDKLTTTITSNHQYLGAVLIDWTNFYHSRTFLYGSDKRVNTISLPNIIPFILYSSLFSFQSSVSFASFFILSSYCSLFLSQRALVFSPRGEYPPPRPLPNSTFVSLLSFQCVI